jgi:3-phenylpropionate/trans-cinnamate dioxygenase ferredoxin reductase subunit
VLGAGFIGAEIAASCGARGIGVAVVDALAEPMELVLGPLVGSRIRHHHQRKPVPLARQHPSPAR